MRRMGRLSGYLAATTGIAIATLAGEALAGRTQAADVVMLYLLGVVLVALRWGRGPSLFGALGSVLAFDFFFVPPYHTLAVTDVRHFVTFGIMLFVAVVVSGLSTRVRAEAEAAAEARLRTALLSSVSHDLRTPLAAITGTATTLLDDQLDDDARKELTHGLVKEGERLERLVRNILDVTKLEVGAVEVRREWQHVEEVVGAALERVEKTLGERPIETDVPRNLPLVAFDSVLVQQVLVNLLENVAKHTPSGSPVAISAHAREGEIEIAVEDRGPGIIDGRERRGGLGLTICAGIVDAHGGRLWSENRDGGGAAFRFSLPVEGQPPPVVEASS